MNTVFEMIATWIMKPANGTVNHKANVSISITRTVEKR